MAVQADYGSLPISFERNEGQTDAEVDFLARGGGYSLFLTPSQLVMSLSRSGDPDAAESGPAAQASQTVLSMNLVGADTDARAVAHDQLAGTVNHFVGADPSEWRTGIPTYGEVLYQDVYQGVDVLYHGSQGALEYDFMVRPGASANSIALSFDGADSIRLADNGDLLLTTADGELRQSRPVLYQEVGGERQVVSGQFVLSADNLVSFEVGRYDLNLPLVIDPVLEFSTFLGGSANDFGWAIAVDSSGRTYVGGETSSAVFPRGNDAPPGPTKPVGLGTDAFVLRMDAEGDGLDFVTFLGGTLSDSGQDLVIDPSGNAYLTGSTASGADNPATTTTVEVPFPITVSAYDNSCGANGFCDGTADHFLTTLDSSGVIQYSTYLGGSGIEQHAPGTPYSGAAGIAVRGTTAYLHSNTFSADFPVTATGFQQTCASCADGLSDGYLSVIDTAVSGASGLLYSTYIGGDGDEQSKAVALDGSGKAYLTGITVALAFDEDGNPTNSFPVKSAYQPTYRGGYSDAYLAKVDPFANSATTSLRYSTFLGGGGLDEGWGVAVRGTKAYVTGYTTSGADPNAFVSPDDPAPDPLPYFPTTAGAFDTTYGGRASTLSGSTLFLDGDAFVFVMNAAGTGPIWSTFVGGPSADYGQGIALDSAGQVYITGWTTCRLQDNRATAALNEAPPQLEEFDDDNDPDTPPIMIPTGRSPGDPDTTGVGDCDGQNPYGASSVPAGTFPQVNPIVDPGRSLDESAMDTTYLGFELHNSPTGVFVTNLSANGRTADYSLVLDGPGFDRGFAIAVRDRNSSGSPITPEAYITGRTGRQGFPVVASTAAGATLYDDTYNGGGRDTFISKLVG